MSYTTKVQVGSDKAWHTETHSQPHTHAYASKASSGGSNQFALPNAILPDMPKISNIKIRSAAPDLSTLFQKEGVDGSTGGIHGNEEEKDRNQSSGSLSVEGAAISTTRRVVTMTFDVDCISPPIANMIRRVILTEVPTLAFDRILIEENDSVVPDELLAHRLGLVPLAGPVAKMQFVTESNQVGFDALDPQRVLVFELSAEGRRDVPATCVYSGDLVWKPLAGQENWAHGADEDRVFIVHPDIILTKLGPGQRLKLRVFAVKGIGNVHAKWSPVSACFYEMRTDIKFRETIHGDCAVKLKKICPAGVFSVNKSGDAEVSDVEKCTLCRECLRRDTHPEVADKVVIEKDKTRIRFTIESVGQLHATQILRHALTLFAERVRDLAARIRSTEANVMCNSTLR